MKELNIVSAILYIGKLAFFWVRPVDVVVAC